mmetsp:Transcript_19254/g.47306  ORF Transcript_19254/g.47306 Transcript_19254/m.47306 type:complete len:366 (+) Transcript_19254:3-1100(+)
MDVERKRFVNFGYKPNPLTGTSVSFYEFNDDFRPLNVERPVTQQITMPGFAFVHDMALTRNFYIVTQPPLQFEGAMDALLGSKPLGSCFSFDDSKPSCVWLVPRAGGKPIVIEVDTHFSFHYANAFENDQGKVVLDVIRAPEFAVGSQDADASVPVWESTDYEKEVPMSTYWRYTLDPRTGTHEKREVFSRYCDFPVVNPARSAQQHRYAYCATGARAGVPSAFRGVARVDAEEGEHEIWLAPEANQLVGEPVYAPRAGSDGSDDDGYLLTFMHDGSRDGKATLLVLRADAVAQGPVAQVELDNYLPNGLHGTFVPGLTPTEEEIVQATKLMNLYARKSQEWNTVDGSFTGLGFKQLFQKGVDGR